MKFKYILSAILSSAVLFSGCVKEEANDSLKSIQVSQTYLSIAPAGSTVTIDVNSTVAWSIKHDLPEWLTASATSGGAGQTKLSFSAPACEYGREAEIQIAAGVHTQFLTVRQGEMTVETVSCKESMEGTAGKTYRVRGAVTSIANTDYGNLYLNDGSGVECYVYGTLDANGNEKNFSSLGIELGDIITVEGPLSFYGTTAELVNVTVIKIEKSLLKLDKTSVIVPAAGGEFVIKAAYKGNGAFASMADDAQGWLALKSMDRIAGIPTKLEKTPADTAVITFSVASNNATSRSSVLSISSSSSAGSSSQTVAVTQLGLSGTEEIPFTVEEAIAFCKPMTTATTEKYWIKGKVSKLASGFDPKYGNGTFWISSDGKYNDDLNKDFEVYRAMYLNNGPFVEGDHQLEVGDEVIICGQLICYKGTCETNEKNAYVVSINTVKDKMTGDGTVENPFNVAAAIGFCYKTGTATTENYYVQGIVTKTLYTFSADYGTGTFWISDDGKDFVTADNKNTDDKTHDFECYSVYWADNQPWAEGDPQVAAGDKVVICGQLTIYKGTAETNSKKAWVYSYAPANR